MHERLSRGLTYGLVGNLLFVCFSIVCFIYYSFYSAGSVLSIILEVVAYTLEASGFFCILLAIIDINKTVRMRNWLKLGYPVYIAVELILMIMELNSAYFDFYEPYSLVLAIGHAVFSAAVCFTFLSLDPGKTCLEAAVIICLGVILGGMLGNILNIRIYFSILTNAVAFSALFGAIKWFLSREMIEIDCHGDKARVDEYKSTFF
ncbi:MAG: hypothetical protein E7497_08355 [Ruminococcus sp.]|nr:hypothetical protein [Ruminococcus sp.]